MREGKREEVKPMLRTILESRTGQLTNSQFAEVMDLATTDIKGNHVASKHNRLILTYVVDIAVRCFITLGRGKVA